MPRKRVLEKRGISPYLRGWSSRPNSSSPTTSCNDRRDGESPRVREAKHGTEQGKHDQQKRLNPEKHHMKQGVNGSCDSRGAQKDREKLSSSIVLKSGVFRAPFPAFDVFLHDPSIALQVRNDIKASLQSLQDQPKLLAVNVTAEKQNIAAERDGDEKQDIGGKFKGEPRTVSSSSPPSPAATTTPRTTTTVTTTKPSVSSSSSSRVLVTTDFRRGDRKTSVEKALIERTAWVRHDSGRTSPQLLSSLASGVLVRACQEKENDEFFVCRVGRRFPTCPDFALSVIRIALLKPSCSRPNLAMAQDIPLAFAIRSITRSNLVLTAVLLATRDFGLSSQMDIGDLCRAAALRVKIIQGGRHPMQYTISSMKKVGGRMRNEQDDGGKRKREGERRREGRDVKEEGRTGDREGEPKQEEGKINDGEEEKMESNPSIPTSCNDEPKREINHREKKMRVREDPEEENEEESLTTVYSFYRHTPKQDKARERVHVVISSKPVDEALRVLTMLDTKCTEVIEQELQDIASKALLRSPQPPHSKWNNNRSRTEIEEGDVPGCFDHHPSGNVTNNEKDKDNKGWTSSHAKGLPQDDEADEEEGEEEDDDNEVRGLLQQRLVCTGKVELERREYQRRTAKVDFTRAERNRGGVNNRLFIVNREKHRSQKIRHVFREYYYGAQGGKGRLEPRTRATKK